MRRSLILCCVLLLTAATFHIELETASPGPGAQATEPPTSLRLRFSAFIEAAYTSVSLTAPDGQRVGTGPLVFVDGSDREFTASLPRLEQPGEYTVDWRTAGADGHVLRGSYTFTLLADPDSARAVPADSPAAPGAEAPAPAEHDHAAESRSDGALEVLARLLQFVALTALLGAVSFRALLLPRLPGGAGAFLAMQRGSWRVLSFAALALGAAIVIRLWLQSVALHGAGRAWSTPLLSMMLTDTSWGRAWVLQAFLFVVLGAAIAWARPPRDRMALMIAVPAALGLAAMPALSGHAAGASGSAWLAVINDATHVIAAGVWLGTLLLLATVALPTLLRPATSTADAASPGGPPTANAAAAVRAFSPVALGAAAVVLATGVINSLLHINAFHELLTTSYGRVLLLKVTLVVLVLLAGLVNWRYLTPHLATLPGMQRLRRAAAAELVLALLVLTATALLTGMPRP